MATYPSAQNAYNAAGKPFKLYNYFTFIANRKSDGVAVTFYFSDIKKSQNVTVANVADDTDSTRAYLGGKRILKVPPIKETQANTVNLHELEMSFIDSNVKDMIFGHYMSGAYFEWHQGQADRFNGGKLVARPVCEMFGRVHDVTETTPARDKKTGNREPRFVISFAAHHADFEDANYSLRSYEEGLDRSGDEIFLYVDSVADWPVGWGKEIYRHKNHGNKGGKKDKGGGDVTDSYFGPRK